MSFLFEAHDREYRVTPYREGDRITLEVDGERIDAKLDASGPGAWWLSLDGTMEPVFIVCAGDRTFVHLRGHDVEVTRADPIARLREARVSEGGQTLSAPMPGVVVEVRATEGSDVDAGETVLVIESMKLQTSLIASAAGRVTSIPLAVGQSFEKGAVLALIESLKKEMP
jgi:3-methylcrotonyl-CoA carboxylase alpha subunit